jgi:hypothetical protein
VKHAGPEALDDLDQLLTSIRALPGLKEPRRGVFSVGSKAMLHFHEDPSGLYADVRAEPDGEFLRVRTTTRRERAHLLAVVRAALRARAR